MTTKAISTTEAKSFLFGSLDDLCRDFDAGHFTPILESDIAAYLYHRCLIRGCPLNTIYLATRLLGGAEARKPDLVIGQLNAEQARIRPALICEIKAFQRLGHSDQQKRRRFEGLLSEDIPSLGEASIVLTQGRIEVVIDLHLTSNHAGYLQGRYHGRRRLDVVAERCRDVGAELIWVHPESSSRPNLQVSEISSDPGSL